ncbi:MAG: O-antigen ligase family protein [Deltaproteobacteria bacterium]|nr:O-antigen ligase family protein [Deltaproteobacteria bacterium]
MTERDRAAPEHRRRRWRRNGSPLRTRLAIGAAVLLGVALVGAPLSCGAVHRPVLFPLLATVAALAVVTAVLATTSRAEFRPVHALALPLVFLLVAAAQIVPVPAALRALLDPAGSELLRLAGLPGAQPLSLDPPETYLRFAQAAAALAVGAAAMLLASGRRLRFVAPGLVAAAGLAALVIGFGHRAISEDRIYGLFGASRGLPVGPFINPNHTAEFLELAAFAALAFAFSRPSLDGQRLWKILAAVLAAGALSTLSRGSVLALGSGALVWFLLAPKSDEGEPLHRTRFAAVLIGLVMVVGIAIGFGAEALWGRFAETGADGETRFGLWWDALKVVGAHPAGIGLGAFGRVYPVYRSLPQTAWFQFPENQPLNILIDAGIPGALLVLAACALSLRHFARNARHDRVEASLAAGLVAVLAHNLTDFGLETLGILLPFCAVLGAMFGRQTVEPDKPTPQRTTIVTAAFSAAAVLAGIVLLCSPSTRDFDALLQSPLSAGSRAIAEQASRAHPTDYVYALAEARLQPTDLASAASRLRTLNRAILLCPMCGGAHAEAARDLWRLGRRQQALLEWRTVLGLSPGALGSVVAELVRTGAKPAELVSLANDKNRHDLSRLLLAHGLIDAARQVLADSSDQSSAEYHLVRAQIALHAGDLAAARVAASQVLAAAPRDPRGFLLAADVESRADDRDKAIKLVTDGLRFEPTNVELCRKRLGLLMQTERWRDTDRALAEFRQALGHAGAPMTDANLAAAAIFEHRGQYQRALAEYQAAAAMAPDNVGLLLAVARAAEQAGRVSVAIDAYTAVLRREPGRAEASAALARIHHDKKNLEVLEALPSHTGVEDK